MSADFWNGIVADHAASQMEAASPTTPDGWTISADYIGYTATHDDFDASYEGPEDGWVGNGLQCWGRSIRDCLDQIADIEAEHPHFTGEAA